MSLPNCDRATRCVKRCYLSANRTLSMRISDSRCERSKVPLCLAPVLDEVLQQLEQACRERSLEQLLAAVLRAVPEYQPSALVQAAAEETA